MGAAIGTIPYFSTYQPGALPIASTVYIEIVDSLSATSAQSWNQSQIDFVGKAPAIIPNANPVASDRFAFFQVATGLPKACTLGNFGVPFGNVPTGGSTGQMLVKLSGTNFDAGWSSIIQGPFGVVGTATITGTLKLNGTSAVSLRPQATGQLIYYVTTTGNDSNDGLTALTAFATVQKGIDTILSFDRGSFGADLHIGAGNWPGPSNLPFQITGGVTNTDAGINIYGAGSSLTTMSWAAHGDSGGFLLHAMALDSAMGDGYAGLYVGEYSEVIIQEDVLFKTNTPSGTDVYCYDSGALTFNNNFSVSGNKATFFDGSGYARLATLAAYNITCIGTPIFGAAFLKLSENMVVEWQTITSSGAATGPKFIVTGSNVTFKATIANIPGSTPGTYTTDAVDIGETLAELATATTFAFGGTTTVNGRFGVTGTTLVTGTFGVIGTAVFTAGLFQLATTGGGSNIQMQSYDSGSGGANINWTMEVVNYNNDLYGDGIGINYSRGTTGTPLPVGSGDEMGGITWRGYDGNDFSRIATINSRIDGAVTATSTPGLFVVSVNPGLVGNVLNDVLQVRGTGAMVIGLDAGTTGPVLTLNHSSPSPAALDQIGRVRFDGRNSAAASKEYAEIGAEILSTTAGAEYGCLRGSVMSNGAMSDVTLATETFLLGYQSPAGSNFEYVFRAPATKTTFMYLEGFGGGATGPSYNIWHNSPSQAAADVPGAFVVDGNADNGTTYVHYSEVNTIITNANTVGAGAAMQFRTVGSAVMSETMRIDDRNNLVIGTAAIASAAVNGFLYLPTTNGTPTGTPTTYAGRSPVVIDSTNNRLYFYSGAAWRNAGP